MLNHILVTILFFLAVSSKGYATASSTPAPADVLSPQNLMDIGTPSAMPTSSLTKPSLNSSSAASTVSTPTPPAITSTPASPQAAPTSTPNPPSPITPPPPPPHPAMAPTPPGMVTTPAAPRVTPADTKPAQPKAVAINASISSPAPTVTLPLPSTAVNKAQPDSKASAAATPAKDSNSLTIVADRWCPYNCDVNAKQQGYMIEIIKEIFSQANMNVNYKILPWSLGVTEVTRGEADAILGMDKLEGKGLIFPTESLGNYTLKIYAKNGSKFTYKDPSSFNNMVLGIVQDYSYGKAINDYITSTGSNKRLFVVSGEEPIATLVNSLTAGKIDLFIEDGAVTSYYLKLHNLESAVSEVGQITLTDTKGDPVLPALYLALSPANSQSENLSKLFDAGIQKLRASGKLKEILSNYGLVDWASNP